jgi:hypothetical protein
MHLFYPILFFILLNTPIMKNKHQENIQAQMLQEWTTIQTILQQHPQVLGFLPAKVLTELQRLQTRLNLPDFMPQGEDKIRQKDFVSVMDTILNAMLADLARHSIYGRLLSESERSEFKTFINHSFP